MLTHRHRTGTAFSLLSVIGATALTLLAIACSDEESPTTTVSPSPPGTDAAPDTTPPAQPGAEAGSDAGARVTIATVLDFDAKAYELPEALSYRDGFAYVSIAPKGEIAKIEVATGKRSVYATLPVTSSNLVLGSAFDGAGNLFVGVGATNPDDAAGVAAAGVYRIPAGPAGASGTAELFASAPTTLKFGNGIAFDAAGNVFVTDAADGAVYKIPPAGAVGTATPWKKDAALSGDVGACPGTVAGFPIGANGIFVDDGAVWIGNTDRGALVKIAIEAGNPGAVTTVAQDCATLEGLDGLRPDPRDPTSAFIGTNNPRHSLVHITRKGAISVIHQGKPPELDGPADLVHLKGGAGATELLVVNSAFPEAFAPPDAGLVPRPSLVKVTLR